jgi:hypothetical protein
MFILVILLGLNSKQGDITCNFLHPDLKPGKNVYNDMLLGFAQYLKNGIKKCLQLKKTLYGLWKRPRAFWNTLPKNSKHVDWNNSNLIPVFLLEQRLFVLFTLMTLSSGVKTHIVNK